MNILAFLSYVIITSITPGPSNILMMNEARRFGFLGSLRFIGGILAGFAFLGLVSGIFTTGLYSLIPVIEPFFKVAGAVYLLFLAWQVGFHTGAKKGKGNVQSSFLAGFIFQMINVKSILFFLTVMTAFILPFSSTTKSVILYLALTIFLGWMALLLWSGFGTIFNKFFADNEKSFRTVMSLLLVYSAVSIFI